MPRRHLAHNAGPAFEETAVHRIQVPAWALVLALVAIGVAVAAAPAAAQSAAPGQATASDDGSRLERAQRMAAGPLKAILEAGRAVRPAASSALVARRSAADAGAAVAVGAAVASPIEGRSASAADAGVTVIVQFPAELALPPLAAAVDARMAELPRLAVTTLRAAPIEVASVEALRSLPWPAERVAQVAADALR